MTLKEHNLNQIILSKRAKMDILEWIRKYAELYRKQNLKIALPRKQAELP